MSTDLSVVDREQTLATIAASISKHLEHHQGSLDDLVLAVAHETGVFEDDVYAALDRVPIQLESNPDS